ncbi:MAG TPA: mannose-1-phosphate guanylyltransferase/mannose-6-phosphate isomerase [Candidatus Gastranaerophilales bacterium]|nr:mannose-1-phosphate guanylyltransferase/mannose-6-phosphate isomerase [Candidatus Gastranaerophilales bacterium]
MNNQNKIFSIILAGGSGSRLWPLSRELYPKQFLSFSQEKSLLQLTYERLKKFTNAENIITITNEKHAPGIKYQIQEKEHKILGEPLAKNTAPALALGVHYIQQAYSDANDPIIIVAPSDHLIKDENKFIEAVLQGAEIAKQGYIITFGIKPSAPETGYGYIKTFSDQKINKTGLKTDCFKEKPDYATALEYVKSGDYFWNSGIFMFALSTILAEFETKEPEIINTIREIDFKNKNSLREKYEQLSSISIDYAIMEKSDKIVLIPAEFDWNDLGSWEAIYEISEKTKDNNVIKGDIHEIDTKNSLIYSSSRFVSTIGIENAIVVETDDAVLVCDRKDCQKVKETFEYLKKSGSELYNNHKTLIYEWGSCKNILKNNKTCVNNIIIKKDGVLKLDSADKNSKHYYITEGTALIKLGKEEKVLTVGQNIDIDGGLQASILNSGVEDLKIIEIY